MKETELAKVHESGKYGIGLSSRIYRVLTRPRPFSRAFRSLVDIFVPVRRRHLLSRFRVAFGKPYATVHLHFAHLKVDLRDSGVGLPLYVNREYEPAETSFVESLLKPNMKVLDIGANLGYFTTLSSKAIGPQGTVIALEPEPHNFELLECNLKRNHCINVTPVRVALGDAPGRCRLFLSQAGNFGDHRLYGGDEGNRESVETEVEVGDALLERMGVPSIDFLKIDVQGYEFRVFKGLKSTLHKSEKITILSEIWPYGLKKAGDSASDLLELFQSMQLRPAILGERGEVQDISWDTAKTAVAAPEMQLESSYMNLIFKR